MADLELAFGFQFADLFDPLRLADLTRTFDQYLREHDESAFAALMAYREARGELAPVKASQALVGAARHLSAFIGELFGLGVERAALVAETEKIQPVLAFKKEVVKKRLMKRPADDGLVEEAIPEHRAFLDHLGISGALQKDEKAVVGALWPIYQALDRMARAQLVGGQPPPQSDFALVDRATVYLTVTGRMPGLAGDETSAVRGEKILSAYLEPTERYLTRWYRHHERVHGEGGHPHPWVSFRLPHKIDFGHLVKLEQPDPALPELFRGPEAFQRCRDGFKLTDRRYSNREIMSEVDYCMLCQDRDKDSCSKGIREKTGAFKANPLGVELHGCPLHVKIGEMHELRARGDSTGALALITLDNPMSAGTGHRICNDCMKACVFQKQESVNIPQAETGALTDVLAMPWGFEIYGLLTRWNPLHPTRQHPRPYHGKNVLVVGLGPAGYTLTSHLLREGFGVVAVDGLKIEPLPEGLVGRGGSGFAPIKDWKDLAVELDDRVMLGFGGVSEYGITVRWDKNFLTLVAATLQRWSTLRVYGGIRFGGTLDHDDAWRLGFDHIAICAGAGKPTMVDVPNGMIRGVRQASDFLMALQLTGAARKSSLANLQVRMPAVVVGGGLTAIDAATELGAYYIVQCEKELDRYEPLVQAMGEEHLLGHFDQEEREVLAEQIEHGRQIRQERQKAKAEGRAPNFTPLLHAWGGITIAYRRKLTESPSYRLNHEEIAKGFEEGIRFAELLSPKEAVPDERGAVQAMRFDRMTSMDGRLTPTGEVLELPARTVCVAAGTQPNTTYGRETPGTFEIDPKTRAFRPHVVEEQPDGSFKLVASPDGFFTSYVEGRHVVSFYGDNLAKYAGSVVKAMSSAKDGYPQVVKLFEKEIAAQAPEELPARMKRFEQLARRLDAELVPQVVEVKRLTETITEVVVKAPLAARKFQPGQFYRLQNYERDAREIEGTVLTTEGLALTGAWTDPEKGLLSMIVLEIGVSSRLVRTFEPGQRVVVMGPTGAPTEIPKGETVLLAGGGLGNAVLFSIGRALRANGCRVLYFAGYRQPEDVFHVSDIEASSDIVVWTTDRGPALKPRRAQDRSYVGNIVQAMVAYTKGELGAPLIDLGAVTRLIAIGSDKMMKAVRDARHGVLQERFKSLVTSVGSINSPMQCMMKEICGQCLQRHVDRETGKQVGYVFSCFNQDQNLDTVDFANLAGRLKQTSMQEKLAGLHLKRLWSLERARKRA